MKQITAFLLITALLLVGQISAYQRDAGNEDYGPEGAGPPGGGDASSSSAAGKPDPSSSSSAGGDLGAEGADKATSENEAEADPAKTKFTDERFAKLFPARAGGRNFVARNVAKPKPTLPSFIKSTQPVVKVQVSTTPVPKGLRARATVPTTKRSSVSTTARPRRGGPLQPTQRQLSGRLSTTRPTTAPNSATASATPSAAALAAARRARQGNGISRFNRNMPNNNSTIPALNPRRN